MTPYETFLNLDYQTLKDWIGVCKEDIHLDCKILSGGDSFNRDDRKNLAKAISGFANSDGGLLVWGVDARSDGSGADVVSGLTPITNCSVAYSDLQSLTGKAVSPLVDNVKHRMIEIGEGSGFIVTYVPRSDTAPHMACLGEKRYFKRSGDSFYCLEHFDLEDMFGRRAHPQLELSLTPFADMLGRASISSGGQRSVVVNFVVALANSGRGIARFPYLQIQAADPFFISPHGLDGNGNNGLPQRPKLASSREEFVFAGGMNDVIHPDTIMNVALVKIRFNEGDEVPDLCLDYSFSAEGQKLFSSRTTIARETICSIGLSAMEEGLPRTTK